KPRLKPRPGIKPVLAYRLRSRPGVTGGKGGDDGLVVAARQRPNFRIVEGHPLEAADLRLDPVEHPAQDLAGKHAKNRMKLEIELDQPRWIVLRIHCREERPHFFKDRKSTRLNSSHVKISYAVFCLKKKIYK